MRVQPLSIIAAIATSVARAGSVAPQDVGPLVIAKRGYFFVGGEYFDTLSGKPDIAMTSRDERLCLD